MYEIREIDQTTRDYLLLLRCGTQDRTGCRERILRMDLDLLCDQFRDNGLNPFICRVLRENGIEHEGFSRSYDANCAHLLLLDMEREQILQRLAGQKIRCTPLKGAVIGKLYPAFGLRTMGDLDILIGKKDRKRAGMLMEELGYDAHDHGVNYHTEFSKGYVMVELHHTLMKSSINDAWEDWMKGVPARLKRDGEDPFRCDLSEADHYIFMIAHAYKHFIASGIGLRFLLDLWYWDKAYPGTGQDPFVQDTLRAMGLEEYARRAEQLSQALFGVPGEELLLTAEQEKDLAFYLDSGVGGNEEQKHMIIRDPQALQGRGVLGTFRGILEQLEEREDAYAFMAPFAYRHRWARPAFVLRCILRDFLADPRALLGRYRTLKKKGDFK